MHKDTVKILTFVLKVLKENDKTAFKASSVYDIYRQFHRVVGAADLVLRHYLSTHFENMSTLSHSSVEEKWIDVNNDNLKGYEAARRRLLLMFAPLDSEYANSKYKGVFFK
jgi:hypothetical protein